MPGERNRCVRQPLSMSPSGGGSRPRFRSPTRAQALGWPPILAGESTLLLAPTGSGKTLAAFLSAIDRLMFAREPPAKRARCRVLYVSPLKALAVDVERNLRAPLAGIAAPRTGGAVHLPTVAVRTGDTPARRARAASRGRRRTSSSPRPSRSTCCSRRSAREILASVETVIVDEIHALVRDQARRAPLPLARAARGAAAATAQAAPAHRALGDAAAARGGRAPARRRRGRRRAASGAPPRPVEIVDAAAARRRCDLRVEVPVDDMARLGELEEMPPRGPRRGGRPKRRIDLARDPPAAGRADPRAPLDDDLRQQPPARRAARGGASTRLAGEEIALAHHGSVARDTARARSRSGSRRGELPAIVATSSLELGHRHGRGRSGHPDRGAAVGRLGHAAHRPRRAPGRRRPARRHLPEVPRRSARLRRGHGAAWSTGDVEETFYPRNPLDVLAQQIVAIVGDGRAIDVDELFALVRRRGALRRAAARSSFEGVLDMLSGRYPSDEFAELRPRITWDRVGGNAPRARGRAAARDPQRRAPSPIAGSTASSSPAAERRAGEGRPRASASSTRRWSSSRARATSSFSAPRRGASRRSRTTACWSAPAPGEPGKMPFWHGDRAGPAARVRRARSAR